MGYEDELDALPLAQLFQRRGIARAEPKARLGVTGPLAQADAMASEAVPVGPTAHAPVVVLELRPLPQMAKEVEAVRHKARQLETPAVLAVAGARRAATVAGQATSLPLIEPAWREPPAPRLEPLGPPARTGTTPGPS